MTLTRRGLRRMTVDGHDYVWRVRLTKCPCCRSRPVVIADASRTGSVIHIAGPVAGFPPMTITPSLIAAKIRDARRRGWLPGTGRGVFAWLDGGGNARS